MVKLPVAFVHDRYLVPRAKKSAFLQRATPFEDFVIRCVRYAFANIPPKIGRVFFSKEVSLPFLWFRLLRHGYLGSPIHWREHREVIPSRCCTLVLHTDRLLGRIPRHMAG